MGGETLSLFFERNDRMEKLNLERNKDDFYILEVNDKGDTIEFDLTDISLPERIIEASELIRKLDKEYQEEYKKIVVENGTDLSSKIIKLEKEQCKKMRNAFDMFLGEGSCQKIFGNKNYYGMFPELFDALEPHFKKMEIKQKKARQKLVEKYLPTNNNVM